MNQCLYSSVVIPGGTPVSVGLYYYLFQRERSIELETLSPSVKSLTGTGALSSIKETYRQSTQAPLLWSPHSLKIQGLESILGQRSGALSRCPLMTSPMIAPKEGPAQKGMSSFTQMWTQLKFTAECLWSHSACEYSSSYMGLYLQSLDRNNSA